MSSCRRGAAHKQSRRPKAAGTQRQVANGLEPSATPPATRFAYFRPILALPPLPPLPPHENSVAGMCPIERPLMSKYLSDKRAALAGHLLATTGHRDCPGYKATRGQVLAAEPGARHPR